MTSEESDRRAEENSATPDDSETSTSPWSFLKELTLLVVTAIVLAWLIKTFIVQPFYIPSGSMEPTLYKDDRVLVSKQSYRFGSASPGDVVVFVAPRLSGSTETDLIKRIIGTGGMRVQETRGKIAVNGKLNREPYIRPDEPTASYGPITVPVGKVFVMGDNRAHSRDSRYIGTIDETALIGKALLIYWPPGRIGLLR